MRVYERVCMLGIERRASCLPLSLIPQLLNTPTLSIMTRGQLGVWPSSPSKKYSCEVHHGLSINSSSKIPDLRHYPIP